MDGKLKEKEMDQLEQWIGTGPKMFTLQYAISRDGCDSGIFHQKCDKKGPTVTVLYNQYDSVYGGYTSVSWEANTTSTYGKDERAFLFQLKYNGNEERNKFQVKKPANAVVQSLGNGPTFGSGCTFSNRINKTGKVFPLNGNLSFGTTFHSYGASFDQINNGTMEVTELEVYIVTDGQRKKTPPVTEPWRKTKQWNTMLLKELKEEVVAFKPHPDLEITDAKILMIGPVGAGKSSFYNTIDSVFRGRITSRAGSGSAEQSLTTTYTQYTVTSGAALNFRLCDTRGLEETMGIDVLECNYLLDGHVPNYYKFNPTSPINSKTAGFKSDPSNNDRIHCTVFVLDSTTLDVLSTKIVEKMKGFRGLMNDKGIPQVLVLTKVDTLCKEVEKDVSCVFRSQTVQEAVEKASQLLGLPRANVLPVKNYESETEPDENIDILALLALRKMLYCVEDFLFNLIEQKRGAEAQMEKLKLEK